jgi:hypothetical protein
MSLTDAQFQKWYVTLHTIYLMSDVSYSMGSYMIIFYLFLRVDKNTSTWSPV